MTDTPQTLAPRAAFDLAAGGWWWASNTLLDEHAARLGPYAFTVYCYLARCADERGQAWPSINRIAQTLGISRDTVVASVRRLVDTGLVTVTYRRHRQGGWTSNLYTLSLPVSEKSTRSTPPPTTTPTTEATSLLPSSPVDAFDQARRPEQGGYSTSAGGIGDDSREASLPGRPEQDSSDPDSTEPDPPVQDPTEPDPAAAGGPPGVGGEKDRGQTEDRGPQRVQLGPQPADRGDPPTAVSGLPAADNAPPADRREMGGDRWRARLRAAGVENERVLGEVVQRALWLEDVGLGAEVEAILSQARLSKLGGGWIVAQIRRADDASIHAPRPAGWRSPLRPAPKPATPAEEFEQIRRDYGGYLRYAQPPLTPTED